MWNASSLGPHAGDKNNRNVTRFSRPNRVPTPRTQALPIFWRNARRGEEEMFHVEHFDPAVGCSIWNIVPWDLRRKALVVLPWVGVENSQSCVPYGTFQLECSTWNIYVNLGMVLGSGTTIKKQVHVPCWGRERARGRPSAQCSTWNTMLALKARVWWIVRSIAVSPTFASII